MSTTDEWPEIPECRFDLPCVRKPVNGGEYAPIVSSCAVCFRSLSLGEITIMSDGEHLCRKERCEDIYRNKTLTERIK